MYNVLLVDDDESILEVNETYLTYKGYDVVTAGSIKEAAEKLISFVPNCIVLDVLLPDGNGIEALDKIRYASEAPVIFLSSLSNEDTIVSGMYAGAEDYVTKPFSPKVLELRILARIRNALEKTQSKKLIEGGGLVIDINAKETFYGGKKLKLTATEFSILLFLSRNAGVMYELDDIYTAVWGMHNIGNPLTVQSHVSNLRRKLKAASGGKEYIKTSWGNGYSFIWPQ